jgi:hypothetical protein
MYAITGLPSKQSGGSGEILRIRHDNEYTLQCIIPFQKGSTKLHMGTFFYGLDSKNGEPIKLNGAFHTNLSIMRFVVASAAEAELGELFHSCQTGMIF